MARSTRTCRFRQRRPIRELFAQHGDVETVSLILDRDTGKPRGFGFVQMSGDGADKAIAALNGAQFGGRALKVNPAQDREKSGASNISQWRGR